MKLTDTEILGVYFYKIYRDACESKKLDMFIAGMSYTHFSNLFMNPFKVGTEELEPSAYSLFNILDLPTYQDLVSLKDAALNSESICGYTPFTSYSNEKFVGRFWMRCEDGGCI
jgi:hypothetical protein